MSEQIKIGKHILCSNVLVAPMSGISDLPFRRACQRYAPGMVLSEMVASEYLAREDPASVRKTAGASEINPLAIQLVGREAKWLAEGAIRAEAAGAEIIDINMGCPARRVTGGLSGSALMRDLDQAVRLIEAVIEVINVPVTLKMRLGWDENSQNAAELARRAEQAGIGLIVVHGRTRQQFYKGKANWRAVSKIVDAVQIPVIVNGDITGSNSALMAIEQSRASGVMPGRGLIGAPWKIHEIGAVLSGQTYTHISPKSAFSAAKAHYLDILGFYGETIGLRTARKHLAGYVEHAPVQLPLRIRTEIRSKICRLEDSRRVIELLRQIYLMPETLDIAA